MPRGGRLSAEAVQPAGPGCAAWSALASSDGLKLEVGLRGGLWVKGDDSTPPPLRPASAEPLGQRGQSEKAPFWFSFGVLILA